MERDGEREGDGKGREHEGREGREKEWRREGERENWRGGTGHWMERERERMKGREREERGYSPPNFNSWCRHCWPGWSKPPPILSPLFLILATPV